MTLPNIFRLPLGMIVFFFIDAGTVAAHLKTTLDYEPKHSLTIVLGFQPLTPLLIASKEIGH